MASTLDFIKQILDHELKLPSGRVWAYNGNQDIPKDKDLFIVLSFRQKTPYSNNTKYVRTETGLNEVQTTNMSEDILISCISQNTQARDRAHEVLLALNSFYSQGIQEANHLHISTTNNIEDNSFIEATSNLNRFDLDCRVMRAYQKIQPIDYYDKFPNTSKFEPNFYTD